MAQLVFGLQKIKILRGVCADTSFPYFPKKRLGPIDGPMAKFCTFGLPAAIWLYCEEECYSKYCKNL